MFQTNLCMFTTVQTAMVWLVLKETHTGQVDVPLLFLKRFEESQQLTKMRQLLIKEREA